jgi:ribosomal protein L16 Arg81 hydroxylase
MDTLSWSRIDVAPEVTFTTLISPFDPARFFAEYWEQRLLIVDGRHAEYYRALLSIADVDSLLTAGKLSYPQIRLTKAGESPPADDYTCANGRIDPVSVCKLFSDGMTAIFDSADQEIPQLARLCRNLGTELGFRFQTNLYLTPPNSGGFPVHYDTHDVFILQIFGSKNWEIFDSPTQLPMPGQHHDKSGVVPGSVTQSLLLKSGELLYIPRGVFHRAQSGSEPSLHITLGAHPRSWCEFLIEAVSELSLRDPSFRRALPIGFGVGKFNVTQTVAHFKELLATLRECADFQACASSFRSGFAQDARLQLEGQLLQTIELSNLGRDSVVRPVKGACYSVARTDSSIKLLYGNSELEIPLSLEKCLLDLLSTEDAKPVRELGGPDTFQDKEQIVRRLVEIGLARVVHTVPCDRGHPRRVGHPKTAPPPPPLGPAAVQPYLSASV